ncbi:MULTISPECIES: PhzF family phenazine biosynthesis protein [Clostridioides]|mgnify:CR=1 FL=1|uniref:PhzF family phenazine biosynthesis protein n=1 Tax=Clostridioides sp. ZZV14-6387 TaxID=2811497 RepID=UPI0006BC0276|nr:phenazine biosynthesis protein [Clostridioides difficile]MCC0690433.1 PhzF family phenazine biosynthesis protein [Clostridioides sp. ZZV14-6387]MCI9976631.1 PhzF family phenazine biosynthesis protein [Clostridioides difficile]MDI0264469.1 PhzF family phenazine biosynthesis protein [Clostridioides difficile]MDI7815942.1 PhzF family phenazine biosynthesis protein [Clostridioides difficile]
MEYYIVDAFTSKLFKGNPAGVCVLDKRLPLELMQKIAEENNLPETAFIVKNKENYELRWFTPKAEIDLCGHATLAAAYIISNFIDSNIQKIEFVTQSGNLKVTRNGNLYELTFPKLMPTEIELSPQQIDLIGCIPSAIYSSRDLILLLNSEQEVINYVPNYANLRKLTDWLGIIITAQGSNTDFVSRYFCPELDSEDPVTGSSHCNLIPYWAERLGKNKMVATQLSNRGGIIQCELLEDNTVRISGEAVLFMQGTIKIDT